MNILKPQKDYGLPEPDSSNRKLFWDIYGAFLMLLIASPKFFISFSLVSIIYQFIFIWEKGIWMILFSSLFYSFLLILTVIVILSIPFGIWAHRNPGFMD